MTNLQRNGDLELVALGVERIHFGIVQRDIEAIDVDIDAFEAVFFDRALDFLQRLLDAKRIVTGEADESVRVTSRVLRHLFELRVHEQSPGGYPRQ